MFRKKEEKIMLKFGFIVLVATMTCLIIFCLAGTFCACILSGRITRELEKYQLSESCLQHKGDVPI